MREWVHFEFNLVSSSSLTLIQMWDFNIDRFLCIFQYYRLLGDDCFDFKLPSNSKLPTYFFVFRVIQELLLLLFLNREFNIWKIEEALPKTTNYIYSGANFMDKQWINLLLFFSPRIEINNVLFYIYIIFLCFCCCLYALINQIWPLKWDLYRFSLFIKYRYLL